MSSRREKQREYFLTNFMSPVLPFRMDWLDLLVVQGVSSIFSSATVQNHQLFGPQLSLQSNFCIHINYGKTIALTRQTFVSKVMSLLFYMLSSLVIAFLPRSKHHLISWLQSPSAVILEPQNIKSLTVSTVSPSICHEVMDAEF